jgi:Fe(3+) dicitrate transport protein
MALHATDAISYRQFSVTPGLRVEVIGARYDERLPTAGASGKTNAIGPVLRSDNAVYSVFLPGVGAYYGVRKDLGIIGGVYRGFSPAPPGQSKEPELSWNAEFGGRLTRRHVKAELIGFLNKYQNLTNICTFSSGCTQEIDRQTSIGSASIYGLEAHVDGTVDLGAGYKLPGRASYTLTGTRIDNAFRSADPQFGKVEEGDELPYVPTHQAAGSIGIEHREFGVNIGATLVGSMRELAGQGATKPNERTDAYAVLDASGYYVPAKHFRLTLNARNLTNATYITSRRPFGARPGAPLSMQLGLAADF